MQCCNLLYVFGSKNLNVRFSLLTSLYKEANKKILGVVFFCWPTPQEKITQYNLSNSFN